MQLNSIRLLPQANPRERAKPAERASLASTDHVRARTGDEAGVVGVSGAGKGLNGPVRATPVLEGSGGAVRVPIVALEHGKAVSVKGDRKVNA